MSSVFWNPIFLDKVPSWTTLYLIGSSAVARSSYVWMLIVPVLANILIKLDREFTVTVLSSEFTLTLGLPFSWKMFFFSALFFSAGTVLYTIFCPEIIRSYQTYDEFKSTGRAGRQISKEISKIVWRHAVNNIPLLFAHRKYAIDFCYSIDGIPNPFPNEPPNLEEAKLATELVVREERLAEAFWFVRELENKAFPIVRACCTSAYLLGFIFMLIVLLQNIWFVLRLTY